ncbi:recombinase family protein [Eisenbergiella porci]|uniref:recombinase family protein n=1 Tax=Eisenbergiella porci TaxID=2652274 RepID=UPI002F42BD71
MVDEAEAAIVRRIYREYLEGKSLIQIARGLEADGILTGTGKTKWRTKTIKKMLSNEKYIGDALLQKTYTVDFLTKKRVKNEGLVPQYYVENSHEGIIPKDLYMQVQEEMVRRANLKAGKKKRVYSSKYALSSLVFCSKCGDIYRRIAWNNRGKHSAVWRCYTRVEHGPSACDAETIPEEDLQMVTVKAFNQLYEGKESMLEVLAQNIHQVLDTSGESLEAIESSLEDLQHQLLKKANSKQSYDKLANEIFELREKKQNIMVESAEKNGYKKRISELEEFLHGFDLEITEYDEQLICSYIQKITVYDDKFNVEFKAGFDLNFEK